MPPAQQPGTDIGGKVSVLRGQLQQSSSRQTVAPLVAAIMARDVHIHERMLTDLRDRVQQMEGSLSSESKHTSQLLERMQHIEQDANNLQELIKEDREKDIDAKHDADQLKVVLSEAINQHSTEMASVGQRLQTIQEAMEWQKKITNRVKEILDAFGQRTESLQGDISGIKDGLESMPLAAPIIERMAKLEERMVKYLDQSSRDAETIKRSLEVIKQNPDPQTELVDATNQTINDSMGDPLSSQSEQSHKEPDLKEWPAIADFVTVYEGFLQSYKCKKPEDDLQFIETFLDDITKVNIHVSCALQRYLLETYPKRTTLVTLEVGQQYPDIFIKLVRMRWDDIKRAIAKLKDLRVFQWASNDGILGPSPSPIGK